MKKIILFILIAICCTACGFYTSEDAKRHSELIDITLDGNTHQYIYYKELIGDSGNFTLSHWPSCKYCSNDENNN